MSAHTINHPIFGPGFECPPPMTFAPRPPFRIDVLAHMEQCARALRSHSKLSDDGDAIQAGYLQHEARAAVAELIGKAESAWQTIANLVAAGQIDAKYSDVYLDLRAALARIGAP